MLFLTSKLPKNPSRIYLENKLDKKYRKVIVSSAVEPTSKNPFLI